MFGKCRIQSPEPCDDQGHGTHVLSTAVGADGFGVAPGARWIACRNMDRGVGSAETYLNCLNFFLAPHDLNRQNADPARRPHAVGNSYGCPDKEGCPKNAMTAAVQALRASGIFMSVSAGNDGPNCSSIRDPPALEPSVVSVGATDRKDALAVFSSRGPCVVIPGVPAYRKPDVSAPGVMVTAAFPNSKFNTLSGTSMASPHVGGLALLISAACPKVVRNVSLIRRVIEMSALPLRPSPAVYTGVGRNQDGLCGVDGPETVPNNFFGWGRIDALAAINYCLALDFSVNQ